MSSAEQAQLVDKFGRLHRDLRLSVTDRCNIRCFYCMPLEDVQFLPRVDILTYEELARFCRIVAKLGVRKLRITGGEPLVRSQLSTLIADLAQIDGIEDIAMTTNGILLADQAEDLKRAGLSRLNVSIDALSEENFQKITRRSGVQRVIDGILAAKQAGFEKLRLNAVAIRGTTEDEIVPLAEFAREHDLELRFIEFMPLDAEQHWQRDQVLSGAEILSVLEARFGSLVPARRPRPSQPATDFRYTDGGGTVGLINPVSEPFCAACDRLRLTAEGKIRNCLFSTTEWDARALLRGDASDETIAHEILQCIAAKKPGHGIDDPNFVRPERAMYQIGG